MNIYLDVNGVLIDKYLKPAKGVVDFLKHTTEKHTVYWLTTHCKGGENNAVWYLKGKLPKEAHDYIEKIKVTDWSTWKTEAIDFSQDFRWLDDTVYRAELDMLREHGCEDKLIQIDLEKNPNQLSMVKI